MDYQDHSSMFQNVIKNVTSFFRFSRSILVTFCSQQILERFGVCENELCTINLFAHLFSMTRAFYLLSYSLCVMTVHYFLFLETVALGNTAINIINPLYVSVHDCPFRFRETTACLGVKFSEKIRIFRFQTI